MTSKILQTSIELTASTLLKATSWPLLSHFPNGTKVFIPWIPGQDFEKSLEAVHIAQDHGLTPVPHVVARNLTSAPQLDEIVQKLQGRNCQEILIVSGGLTSCLGPFESSLDILRGASWDHVKRFNFAVHPTSHPFATSDLLDQFYDQKQSFVKEISAHSSIQREACYISQIAMDPNDIFSLAKRLNERSPLQFLRIGIVPQISVARLVMLLKELNIRSVLSGSVFQHHNTDQAFLSPVITLLNSIPISSFAFHIYGLCPLKTVIKSFEDVQMHLDSTNWK
jgi:hypothetical protein